MGCQFWRTASINRGLGKNYINRISTKGSDEKQHQIFIANVSEMNQLGCFLMASFILSYWLLSCRYLARYSFTHFAASFWLQGEFEWMFRSRIRITLHGENVCATPVELHEHVIHPVYRSVLTKLTCSLRTLFIVGLWCHMAISLWFSEGRECLWNVGNPLSSDAVSFCRRKGPWTTLLWEPQDWWLEICHLISLWIGHSIIIRIHRISQNLWQSSFYNTEQFVHINVNNF